MKLLTLTRHTLLLCLLLSAGAAQAKYAMPQLIQVPIGRVSANLQRQLAQAQKGTDRRAELGILLNLARIQAMTYAYGEKTRLQVLKDGYPNQATVFEGYGSYRYQRTIVGQPGEVFPAANKASLWRAISSYQQALQLKPGDRVATLGLAWCLQQDDQLNEAKALYQRLVNDTVKMLALQTPAQIEETDGLFDIRLASEASGYLAEIYQQTNDQGGLKRLQTDQAQINQVDRALTGRMPITPIAIPLRDDLTPGELIDRKAHVTFDLDGNGKQCWRWINDNAAWLVHRQPGVEAVASGRQLFGAVTFSLFWQNGYQALATLDDNGDGQLSGAELTGLALWRDTNHNGIAEVNEVKPLADYHISALRLSHQSVTAQPDYIAIAPDGVQFDDGKTRPSYDLLLTTCKG